MTSYSLTNAVDLRYNMHIDHTVKHEKIQVTAFGYSIFLISPLLVGFLAAFFSLRIALLLTIVTSVGVILIAQRLPGSSYMQMSEGE